jgi:hypothetical protein
MALSTEQKILEKLDQILKVLAIEIGEGLSLTERVRLLKTAGLDNQTMADVLNTTPATIRALSSTLGKQRVPNKKKASTKKG